MRSIQKTSTADTVDIRHVRLHRHASAHVVRGRGIDMDDHPVTPGVHIDHEFWRRAVL